jgi:hypothetical protein
LYIMQRTKSTIRIGCVLPLFPISCHLDDVWWAHASSNSKGNAKPLVVLFNYIQLLQQKKSVGKILFCKGRAKGVGERRQEIPYVIISKFPSPKYLNILPKCVVQSTNVQILRPWSLLKGAT